MPPEASSRPEIGLKRTETSTSRYGPPGATMTLKGFFGARCTSTPLPLGAPGISSTLHWPSTDFQPVSSACSKSKRSLNAPCGRVSSSARAEGLRSGCVPNHPSRPASMTATIHTKPVPWPPRTRLPPPSPLIAMFRFMRPSSIAARARLRVQFYRPSDRLPGRVAALHVLRVEAGVAKRDGGFASDVEPVGAKHYDRVGFRQLPNPFVDPLRVTPYRAVHDVLLSRDVRPGAGIDDLDRLARVQHGLDVLDRDTGQVAELLLDEGPRSLDSGRVLVARLRRHPIDVAVEGIDIRGRVRSEIDVVRVLVHVQGQDRNAARGGLAMIACVLIDEPAVARYVDEQHPPRAAGQTLRHRDELTPPAVHRTEVSGQNLREHLGRPSIPERHAGEVQLVKKCRVERDQLFTLQAVDDIGRGLLEVE